jgi:hypothetical protein
MQVYIYSRLQSGHILLLFMSMGRDYVSELRPPTGLFFIPQVISEYGQPRWNNTDRKTEELGEIPFPVGLCQPQIPHGLTQARTRATVLDIFYCFIIL